MTKSDFKITCESDKKLALIAIDIINHLDRLELYNVFSLMNRYSNIMSKH